MRCPRKCGGKFRGTLQGKVFRDWKVEGGPSKEIEGFTRDLGELDDSGQRMQRSNSRILTNKKTTVTSGSLWGWLIQQLKNVT